MKKKKLTEEEIEQFIKNLVEKARAEVKELTDELDKKMLDANNEMDYAEMELIGSFTPEQKQLYVDYLTAKQKYCEAVTNKYKYLNEAK